MNHQADQTVKLTRLQSSIRARKGLIGCGEEFSVALHSRGRILYTGSDRYGQGESQAWSEVTGVVCGRDHVYALPEDGTLRTAGRSGERSFFLEGLSCVRRVACGDHHTAALLGNGRVAVGGDNRHGQCNTDEWPTVTDVCCGRTFTVGLTEAGQLVTAGAPRALLHRVRSWQGVAGIFTDFAGKAVYAITAGGKLLSTAPLPPRVERWRNLVFMAANDKHIWAVTATGQLLSTDPAVHGMDKTKHYVACAASNTHALALTRDGLILAVGRNDFGQCNTTRFGAVFHNFEEFSADRRARNARIEADERAYQVRYTEAARYRSRLSCGKRLTACITADGRVLTSAGFGASKQWSHVRALACGNAHILALHSDGRVSADGNDVDGCCAVSDWVNVKAVAAGKYHSLGLTEDGCVLFCGRNDKGQGNVADWRGIRTIRAADDYTVGVTCEGTLLVAGQPPFDLHELREVPPHPIDLVATPTHMVCLYENGLVYSTRRGADKGGLSAMERSETASWRNVRAIAAGREHTVGLCYGGHVLACGRNDCGQCDVADWRHIASIGCGDSYTVGLTADGRVLAVGRQIQEADRQADRLGASAADYAAPDTSRWQDVLAFRCGPEHLVAMNREGQVLACGADGDSQCTATTHFTLFRDVRQLYGYGNYRKVADCGTPTHTPTAENVAGDPESTEDICLQAFSTFSAHLREDTQRFTSRMAGSDAHLTVLAEDGKVVSYVYETARTVTEPPAASPVSRMIASPDSTVLLYADGRARERCGFDADTPAASLPNKLGDSPFYRVTDVAVGAAHRAVLLDDGTVRCFGDNTMGQCDTASWNGIIAVAAGANHTVGLRADGTVVATGARRRESGNRTRGVAHLPRINPCAVGDWTGVRQLVCAADVTLGLCFDGTVKAAGNRNYGQCHTASWRGVVSVATSGQHTVALFADGHVEAIGLNESGECRTEDWRRVVQIAVLPELTMGLRADGRVLAAGRHHRVLETLDTVRAIACFGTRRQVFVMADGTLRLHVRGSEYLPEPAEGLRLFTPSGTESIFGRYMPRSLTTTAAHAVRGRFAVGMAHTVWLGEQGTVTATGANDCGQCDIMTHEAAVRVAAGPYHSAAILPDGRIALTGRNGEGQCDARVLNRELGTVIPSAEEARTGAAPIAADSPSTSLPYAWKQVACGYRHTAAVRTDGRVYAIGANPDGRCDTRQWRNITDLACGYRHTVGLTENGTCVAVGNNQYGQCDVTLWKDITMVAAGEFHTVALRADGRVEAVGDNRKGQCRVDDLRDIVSIACLPEATLCVRADGRVVIRGGSGELDRAVETLREVVALAACEYRIGALTADRRLIRIPSASAGETSPHRPSEPKFSLPPH